MRVILTGGGTGGHLYPGLSILEALEKKIECDTLFVGTKQGIENQVIPQRNIPLKRVWMSGLHRGRLISNLLFPLKMIVSLFQSLDLIMQFQPDVVVGTGGYVSWPVMSAAILLGKKTVIQEQNRKPGLVTRLLAPWVDSVHLSFESSKDCFRKQKNLVVSGNPTRDGLEMRDNKKAYQTFNLDPKKTTLFIFGGSQGARAINQIVCESLDSIFEIKNVQILWSTGPRWIDFVIQRSEQYKDRICILPYIDNMGEAYAISDLVVCRSGASTIAELTRLGVPALFIPFPAAAGGHQVENAKDMAQNGAAEMILQKDLSTDRFVPKVSEIISDQQRLLTMAKKSKRLGKPSAAYAIAKDILLKVNLN